jgi:pSer/pThr/pTyr-binding forkhead associated (FHA) protein
MQAFSVKLSGSTLTVGRSETCDVTLPLETVSAEHCRVYRKYAAWYVQDLGSRNGTRVNGELVRARRLRVGDTLSVADFDFRVC